MADFDTTVDVGDKKTLELISSDPAGNELSDVDAEVIVSSPSGESTTYDETDMTQNGASLFLEVLFDEAGYWFFDLQVTKAGGQESDSGFVRAITRAPADLRFFTRDVWPDYLSAEAMWEDPEEIMRLAAEAERTVVDRYRETRPDGRFQIEGIDGEPLEEDVQLDGWIEDDQDNIDLDRTDDALIDALRATVGAVVEWHLERPDEAEHVESKSQGDRSVTFRSKDLPSSVYGPLRRFDTRSSWF